MRLNNMLLGVGLLMFTTLILGQTSQPPKTGVVYYFGFDIERITGIPEHQIEQYGCRYTIQKGRFISLLKSAPKLKNKYDPRDIRARISFGKGVDYFVNREGIVRYRNKYFVLDKTEFVHLLSRQSGGKC